jgi:hypothetical protein
MNPPSPSTLINILCGAGSDDNGPWINPWELAAPEIDYLAAAPSALPSLLTEALLQTLSAEQRSKMGIILATRRGSQSVDEEFDLSRREADGRYTSPAAFTRTLPSSLPTELSIKFQIHGPLLLVMPTPSQDSEVLAYSRAYSWFNHFQLDHILAGTFEQYFEVLPELHFALLTRVPSPQTKSFDLTAFARHRSRH